MTVLAAMMLLVDDDEEEEEDDNDRRRAPLDSDFRVALGEVGHGVAIGLHHEWRRPTQLEQERRAAHLVRKTRVEFGLRSRPSPRRSLAPAADGRRADAFSLQR